MANLDALYVGDGVERTRRAADGELEVVLARLGLRAKRQDAGGNGGNGNGHERMELSWIAWVDGGILVAVCHLHQLKASRVPVA